MTELTQYFENFSSWQEVADQFSDYGNRGENALKLLPEPEQVFFAGYVNPSYDGDAVVAYRNGDKYFIVTGSHCSCYGLEGQFEPEEYTKDLFIEALERKIESGHESEYLSYRPAVWQYILDQVKPKDQDNATN